MISYNEFIKYLFPNEIRYTICYINYLCWIENPEPHTLTIYQFEYLLALLDTIKGVTVSDAEIDYIINIFCQNLSKYPKYLTNRLNKILNNLYYNNKWTDLNIGPIYCIYFESSEHFTLDILDKYQNDFWKISCIFTHIQSHNLKTETTKNEIIKLALNLIKKLSLENIRVSNNVNLWLLCLSMLKICKYPNLQEEIQNFPYNTNTFTRNYINKLEHF